MLTILIPNCFLIQFNIKVQLHTIYLLSFTFLDQFFLNLITEGYDGRTDGRTDGLTDGRTEKRGSFYNIDRLVQPPPLRSLTA